MSGQEQIDLSIIIVNYKVKEFLSNLLTSIYRAQHGMRLEIFVVDNASGDDSVEYLRSRFPKVNYIANDENLGFGRANNQAIKQAQGKYTLMINPDTIVREDTLTTLFEYMENHSGCGAAGCKILNPDGSFAPESRRSIPTIWSALCKLLGLSALFPNSSYFNQYYINSDPDTNQKVPVLSGSFMFFRTSVLQELNGFDERFFMYGEDIDLCYRLHRQTDYHIDYVGETSIIHYKGESTKRDDIRYIKNFNKALYLFFEKHYTFRYSLVFRLVIYFGIILRGIISFIKNKAVRFQGVLMDLIVINTSLVVAFPIRYGIGPLDMLQPQYLQFFWINGLVSFLYLGFTSSFGVVKRDPYSVIDSLKSVASSYTGVVFITFFVRSLAFSRLVLVVSGIVSFLLIGFIRVLRKNAHKNPNHSRGRIRPTRVFIIGMSKKTRTLVEKIHSRVDWDYEIVGIVTQRKNKQPEDRIANVDIVGSVGQLPALVQSYNVDQLLFLLNAVSYKEVLQILTELSDVDVVSKLIPDSMDFMLGKSNVEYLADIPLIDLELTYQTVWARLMKRVFELGIAIPSLLVLTPTAGLASIFTRAERRNLKLPNNGEMIHLSLYQPITTHCWKNLYRLLLKTLSGNIRLVGAPLWPPIKMDYYGYEYGITGLAQVNTNRIFTREDREQFDLYYLQNYSIWQDIDILTRTAFNGPCPCTYIEQQLLQQPEEQNEQKNLRG